MGFKHRICTPENPQANGFVEVFQKVLIKMIHTTVAEKKDPRKVIHGYLASYRAAPHKTTGKSPYEMMFNRKMVTKLPQVKKKINEKLDKEVRSKHNAEKEKQKNYSDDKRKAKEKRIVPGDKILVQQKKTSTRTPWDPAPYTVVDVQGSKVKGQRGEEVKFRAKNRVKVLKERPEHLKVKKLVRGERRQEEELDLDVDLEKIRVLSIADPLQQGEAEQEEGREEGQGMNQQHDDTPLQEQEGAGHSYQLRSRDRLSPRAKKRVQAWAKYKKKDEPLRTKMAIKERWCSCQHVTQFYNFNSRHKHEIPPATA